MGRAIISDRQTGHSVIIPAYNAEKTIGRCLDSVLAAALSTSEVIVVNDGSTDGTARILAEYAARDKRLRVLTQENSGVSAARNVGLSAARGDTVSFADSDDYVSLHYFEAIEQAFRRNGADVVFFGYVRVREDGEPVSHHALPDKTADYWENLKKLSEADMFGYTWCKAFRKAVLNGVRFDEKMSLFEDEVFTTNALKKPLEMEYLQEELYFYVCTNEGTLSRKTNACYQRYCDLAYCAWKDLLKGSATDTKFLQEKANHFSFVCKYYGLERLEKPMQFFQAMSECVFLQEMTLDDPFLIGVREKNWHFIKKSLLQYRAKLLAGRLLKR